MTEGVASGRFERVSADGIINSHDSDETCRLRVFSLDQFTSADEEFDIKEVRLDLVSSGSEVLILQL